MAVMYGKKEIETLRVLQGQFDPDLPYGGSEVLEVIENMIELLKDGFSLEEIKEQGCGIG